jgi:NAD(P)-dependent dehydrogenase (short-subunit alcohol dehydrogenase family)
MTTIAIIGAGKGLGLAVARRFGLEGHAVALIARNRTRLDELTAGLRNENHRGGSRRTGRILHLRPRHRRKPGHSRHAGTGPRHNPVR